MSKIKAQNKAWAAEFHSLNLNSVLFGGYSHFLNFGKGQSLSWAHDFKESLLCILIS